MFGQSVVSGPLQKAVTALLTRENCKPPQLGMLTLMGDEYRQNMCRIPPTLVGRRILFTLLCFRPFGN